MANTLMLRLLLIMLFALACQGQAPVLVYGPIGSSGGSFPYFYAPPLVFSADADHTRAFPEMSSPGFVRVTSTVPLTAQRNLIVPQTLGFGWCIQNASTGGQPIQVVGTGVGVVIANGATSCVYSDGTNYVTTATGSGGGIPLSSSSVQNISSVGWNIGMTNCTSLQCMVNSGTYSVPANSSANGEQDYAVTTLVTNGPGTNLGNSGGWSSSKASTVNGFFERRGISTNNYNTLMCGSVSDCQMFYGYMYSRGALAAQSDEGDSIFTGHFTEGGRQPAGGLRPFAAQILVGGVGNRSPTFQNVQYDGLADGTPLLDLTQGTLSGTMTANGTLAGTWLQTLAVGSVPISTGYGTSTTFIANPGVPASTITTATITVNLGTIGGDAAAFTTGFACIAGPNYPQQTYISDIHGYTAGTTETLTIEVRYPNGTGSYYPILFQGGVCGQYLSLDADYTFTGGYRTSYFALGSVDGTNLIYSENIGGNVVGNMRPQIGQNAATLNTGSNGWHLYPGAEIVANTTLPYQPDSLILEHNPINWAPNDYVEDPHFTSLGGRGIFLALHQETSGNSATGPIGIELAIDGHGINNSAKPLFIHNDNPFSYYDHYGGPYYMGSDIVINGRYTNGMEFLHGPDISGGGRNTLFDVNSTATGDNTSFNLFTLPYQGNPGGGALTYNPASGDVRSRQGGFVVAPAGGGWFHFEDYFTAAEYGGLSYLGTNSFALGSAAGTGNGTLTLSTLHSTATSVGVYTVATLPAASSYVAGTMLVVSDSASYTPGTCAGGGTDTMIAVTNGNAWSCH